eukprot:6185153-Pleurochrysis_carterae.AAC.1
MHQREVLHGCLNRKLVYMKRCDAHRAQLFGRHRAPSRGYLTLLPFVQVGVTDPGAKEIGASGAPRSLSASRASRDFARKIPALSLADLPRISPAHLARVSLRAFAATCQHREPALLIAFAWRLLPASTSTLPWTHA